jgi:uncharacterized OsmC-like protein
MATSQAMTQKPTDRVNGLDTQRFVETVDAVKHDTTLARFEFRARNQWIGGMVTRTSVQDFYGAGAEDRSRAEPFTFTSSEPPVLLGANEGAGAGEVLLHALASCVASTAVLHATARGIRIDSIATELKGEVDLRGLLGLDSAVRPGYQRITVKMAITADCSDAQLDELLQAVRDHSPMYDSISRPVPVVLERVA